MGSTHPPGTRRRVSPIADGGTRVDAAAPCDRKRPAGPIEASERAADPRPATDRDRTANCEAMGAAPGAALTGCSAAGRLRAMGEGGRPAGTVLEAARRHADPRSRATVVPNRMGVGPVEAIGSPSRSSPSAPRAPRRRGRG